MQECCCVSHLSPLTSHLSQPLGRLWLALGSRCAGLALGGRHFGAAWADATIQWGSE